MPNPDGTYTRAEHGAAIYGLYRKNKEAGMDDDKAMTEAGKTWRDSLKNLADAKIAYVKAELGIPD